MHQQASPWCCRDCGELPAATACDVEPGIAIERSTRQRVAGGCCWTGVVQHELSTCSTSPLSETKR